MQIQMWISASINQWMSSTLFYSRPRSGALDLADASEFVHHGCGFVDRSSFNDLGITGGVATALAALGMGADEDLMTYLAPSLRQCHK